MRTKRNWFVGVRTPWTLSNDEVWEKTNRLAGRLFQLAGLIALIGLLFPAYVVVLLIVPIVAASVFTVVYSYVLYARLERRDMHS